MSQSITCPACHGEGNINVTYEPDTNAWDGEECAFCDGTGSIAQEPAVTEYDEAAYLAEVAA